MASLLSIMGRTIEDCHKKKTVNYIQAIKSSRFKTDLCIQKMGASIF